MQPVLLCRESQFFALFPEIDLAEERVKFRKHQPLMTSLSVLLLVVADIRRDRCFVQSAAPKRPVRDLEVVLPSHWLIFSAK
jgi:hypothetical protein